MNSFYNYYKLTERLSTLLNLEFLPNLAASWKKKFGWDDKK
jgi:hypothetical protein